MTNLEEGLERLIDSNRLFPLTSLGLRKSHERALLAQGFVLLSDVVKNRECLYGLLPEKDAERALTRAKGILGQGP